MTLIARIVSGVTDGSIDPRDVVEQSLQCVEQQDPALAAWVYVDAEAARLAADSLWSRLQQGHKVGRLAGVPVGIKDIIDVAGMPTACGVADFARTFPRADAEVVGRLRQADAIILGKTATAQFAYLDPADTRNPLDRSRTPGGSSSGSAAAVAAGMVPLALGSQTIGSTLRPAAYCGIVGFKPSWGALPLKGVFPLAQSFDHVGIHATSIADVLRAFIALTQTGEFTLTVTDIQPPELAVLTDVIDEAESETAAAVLAVVQMARTGGAEVVERSLGLSAARAITACYPLLAHEAARVHQSLYTANAPAYGPKIAKLVVDGLALNPGVLQAARSMVGELSDRVARNMMGVSALILPTAPALAPLGRGSTGPGYLCGIASFSGLPSISLPIATLKDKLPFAVQLIGDKGEDVQLLKVAAWLESHISATGGP